MSKKKNKMEKHESQTEEVVETPTSLLAPTIELEPVRNYEKPTQLYGGISPVIGSHIRVIEDYIRAMMPGTPITAQQGAVYQSRLYNALLGIIGAEQVSDMVSGMDRVMAMFTEYSQTAMHPVYLQRFIADWAVDEKTRDLFSSLCTVLSTYCNAERRRRYSALMNINGERNVFSFMREDWRNRLVQYLQRYAQVRDNPEYL